MVYIALARVPAGDGELELSLESLRVLIFEVLARAEAAEAATDHDAHARAERL